jgi:hypothetical protein
MLQKRHSGKYASKKTLWKTCYKRHFGKDTSKKTLWKRRLKKHSRRERHFKIHTPEKSL